MKSVVRRRLLTIGHSYCVELNRRLPQELARLGDWDVTAVAPARFHGDFAWHTTEVRPGEPCRVVAVPVHFSRPVHTMLYGSALRRLLQQPWDLVHVWEEPYVASAAQIARATPARVPLVLATFQNINKHYPVPFRWFERYSLRRADGMIAYGETVRAVLDARGWSLPTRTIPPGVDTTQFAPDPSARDRVRAKLSLSGDVPVVGFLGRFIADKGLPLLMRVLDSLTTPWRALLVGSGSLDADVRAWSRRHGDRVQVQPAVGHAEVPGYLNAMDVLCAPSQTTAHWREQFGRMLIEAFACGVPVVASRSGEIPYVVGDAGIVIGERDERQWALTLDGLLGDRARCAELGRRGRQRAESVYAWPVVARQHLAFFDDLMR